jgi:hypothetical protein
MDKNHFYVLPKKKMVTFYGHVKAPGASSVHVLQDHLDGFFFTWFILSYRRKFRRQTSDNMER